ncbi:DHH family phosphoesterase [Halonotius pteroides]|uniref:Recombinase RecJ n=1 Tax=Halonotius pteroides TaxID=268735 RepID=A0A3A6QSB1_9EURY|nr:DHH family phosphoesterase [Halonotius pteroides]RJX51407.1 recombinase RecJ [Halonotius pteroides]
MASSLPVPELAEPAAACAERLLTADSVILASHIDADGLTSATIAATALERAGIRFETVFAKQLGDEEIAGIAATDHDTALFTDFGSGQLDIIADHEAAGEFTPVIADHHQPADTTTEYHLNPLLYGLDGATELSGAGATYVLARALGTTKSATDDATRSATDGGVTADAAATDEPARDNRDLAGLAVVGAVGDRQAGVDGLTGANEAIVEEGVAAGVVEAGTDITLYGKQTRPLPKLLEYATEARIPGISNDTAGAIDFLTDLDLELETDDGWRCWVDLTDTERQTLLSELIQRAVASGVPADRIDNLVGTSYQLVHEEPGTVLRDASEFSTLLNATARYERADVGLAVCLGDRAAAFEQARTLLRTHRKNLSQGVDWVTSEGVTTEDNVQWFDAGNEIRATILGIIAGMAIGESGIRRELPIIGFAEKSTEEIKVSARGNHTLTAKGLDLSVVMRDAARAVDGDGGGHDVAAGATIPAGKQSAFVAVADELVGEQLSS